MVLKDVNIYRSALNIYVSLISKHLHMLNNDAYGIFQLFHVVTVVLFLFFFLLKKEWKRKKERLRHYINCIVCIHVVCSCRYILLTV